MDPDSVQWNRLLENSNEAIAPPNASNVPSTRLSNFLRGGTAVEYPPPNSSPRHQLPLRNEFTTSDQAFRCGSLNEAMEDKPTLLFSEVKLEALLSGSAESTRTPYKTDWAGWGGIFSVRGVAVWLRPGGPGRYEPLLAFLIRTSKTLGRKSLN